MKTAYNRQMPVAYPTPRRQRIEMPTLPKSIKAPAYAYRQYEEESEADAIAKAIARKNGFRAYLLSRTGTYTPDGGCEYQLTLGQPTRNGQTVDREIRFWR